VAIRSVFTGSGSFIPTQQVTNAHFEDRSFFLDYDEPIDPADNARVLRKITEITDIAERRYAGEDHVASDLGFHASVRALEDSGIDPETLDYVIVAHNFGDVKADSGQLDTVPTLAARIKQRLGIRNPSCVAYDLPFGCPGWLQAVIQADYYLRSGDAHRILIVGSETLSRVCDPCDRDSMIYADGAGAAVMEAVETDAAIGVLSHSSRSDTLEHAQLLRMAPSFDRSRDEDRLFLKMEGRKLYEYAVKTVPAVVRDALDKADLTLTDVSKVLVHQANAKLDESILKRLFRLYGVPCIPDHIMPLTVSWLGNSSVATLPTLFDLIRRDQMEHQVIGAGDLLVFASVGAGMNANAMIYRAR
jgi:3-oxoacyl-[acyl-carrier-protein] synthase-3